MGEVLGVKDVVKAFSGVQALRGVSISYDGGSALAVIGPNGSGKSTLLNVVTGLCRCDAGDVTFFGETISGKSAASISRMGIRRSFQEAIVFNELTVRENLLVAAKYAGLGVAAPVFAPGADTSEAVVEAVRELLNLETSFESVAGSLPYGELRKIGIGMALAGPCRLLLLDEPAAGLNHDELKDLAARLRSLSDCGMPLIVIDHNMRFIADLCDDVVVLDQGMVIASGAMGDVVRDPNVIDVYLGSAERGSRESVT